MTSSDLRAQFAALATCTEDQFEPNLAAGLVAFDAFFAAQQPASDPIVSATVTQQSGAVTTLVVLTPPQDQPGQPS